MTADNLALVERIYEIFASRGLNTATIETMVEEGLIVPDGRIDLRGVYADSDVVQGIAEFAEFIENLPWGTSIRFEPEGFEAVDSERVFVPMILRAAGEASGAPVEVRGAHVITIRDGRAVLLQSFMDRDAARASLRP